MLDVRHQMSDICSLKSPRLQFSSGHRQDVYSVALLILYAAPSIFTMSENGRCSASSMHCKINIKVISMAQDRFMALDALALMRHSNASWKLLASDDAAFCCAFFYQEFLAGNVRNLPEARLLMDMRRSCSRRRKHSRGKRSCTCAAGRMRSTAGFAVSIETT